jgi:hypothetical protein
MKINERVDNYDRVSSQYIVAFLDILGSAERIKNETNNQKIVLNTLHILYTFSMSLPRKIAIESYIKKGSAERQKSAEEMSRSRNNFTLR